MTAEVLQSVDTLPEESCGVGNLGTFDTRPTEIGSVSGISCNAERGQLVLQTQWSRTLLPPPSPHDGNGSSFRNAAYIPQTIKLTQNKKVMLPLCLID
jgi:hypothetical protein